MPLTIISRRSITYRESGSGEMTVLMVPGRDQIQVVKDLAGMANSPVAVRETAAPGAKAQAMKKQIQLARVHVGRRFIYGSLPPEISDLRQPVKVWLAEDFAPTQSQAFFYIFSKTVIIHGVREQDDEGYQTWRTAQLAVNESDPLKSMIDAISDYALANPTEGLTVAVLNKLDIYEKLQVELATYNVSPIPFSKLKPQSNLKPLYVHRDYTILYLTLALFGIIILIASGVYYFTNSQELKKIEGDIKSTQAEIDAIKLNQNVGKIADPQAILLAMSRSVNQQPSAILHAAGESGAEFGKLSTVKAVFDGGNGVEVPSGVESGQLGVLVSIEKMDNELLIDQEQKANSLLLSRPWIREIRRTGSVGDRGELVMILQIDQAPSATIPQGGE